MRILALDTSTENGSCALWLAGDCHERSCPAGSAHSATLLPLIDDLLAESGLRLAQLDGIAFAAGPGAFTGLRMACAVAQGLALGADLPLLAVGSLDALALAAYRVQPAQRILTLLDARMGELYQGLFAFDAGQPCQSGGLHLLKPEAFELPIGTDCLLAGNALRAYPALSERALAAGFTLLPEVMPGAATVAALAAPRFAAGESLAPEDAAPLYIRDKVAQTVAERLAAGGRA